MRPRPYPPRKPANSITTTRRAVNLWLDDDDLARLAAHQRARPELESLSAVVRYLARVTPTQEPER